VRYRLVRGRVEVTARTPVDDTKVQFGKLDGTIEVDPDRPDQARADLTLDLRVAEAGDRAKSWRLQTDLDAERFPIATFTLARITAVHEPTAGQLTGTVIGQLDWAGHRPLITVRGSAAFDRRSLEVRGSFELDLRELGITPPRFLMFRVDDFVRAQVTLFAVAAGK
jgi:polyisoprenoid-binding protein YceI